MTPRRQKVNKMLATLVAACLVFGLLPLVTHPQASAATFWENWTELGTTANRTLSTGSNYKVTTNTTITATTVGQSGLIISGTVTIYIAEGVTLSVTGASGSTTGSARQAGGTGGAAGIRLASGSTLIIRGEGTLSATGGNGQRAGNGTVGSTAQMNYPNNNNYYSGSGGTGGGGAGGGGAGIGTNGANGASGGNGGGAVTVPDLRHGSAMSGYNGSAPSYNGSSSTASGTLYVLDSVTVTGTAGNGGEVGTAGSSANNTNFYYDNCTRYVGSGGGGGRGAAGGGASGIGTGGYGGGGGGGGGSGGYAFQWGGAIYTSPNGGSGGSAPGGGGLLGESLPTADGTAVGGTGGNSSANGTKSSSNGTVYKASGANVTGAASTTGSQYTITFDANGANVSDMPADQEKFANIAEYISYATPMRTGYTFIGWNTAADGSGTSYAPGSVYSTNGNYTLYAQWKQNHGFVVDDQTISDFNISGSASGKLFEDFDPDDIVTITLTVEEENHEAPGAEEILDIARGRMLQFFDITVTQKINDEDDTVLTELPVSVQVVIDLSPELSGKTGYSVYRYHNSKAELLGMDNTSGEYYTVSRGTGAGGVDQIVIYTKKFSTYAVVEHIVSLGGSDYEGFEEDSDEFEVQARIIDGTPAVYHIDIEWGDMKFEYYPEVFAGVWNTETSTYESAKEQGWHGMDGENNKITVTNRSNADVTVNIEVTENLFDNLPDAEVEMKVYTTEEFSEEFAVEQEKPHLGKVPAQGAEALSIDAYLRIDGEPVEPNTSDPNHDNHPAEQFHRVGTITVTITPDGDSSLTPR